MTICVWLHSFNIMVSRFIYLVACIRTSFPFLRLNNSPLSVYGNFICPVICWWTFGLFPSFVLMNSVAMNIHVPIFYSFGPTPRSRIVGHYGNSIQCFKGCWEIPLKLEWTQGVWLHAWKSGDAQEMGIPFPALLFLSSNLLFSLPPSLWKLLWVYGSQWSWAGRQTLMLSGKWEDWYPDSDCHSEEWDILEL